MAKGRSPNYPQITLAEALQRIRPLYDASHTYPTEKPVIAENLGYTGLHGRSLTLIAALRRYGLLEAQGEGMRVSDDAVTMLELPQGDPHRAGAIEKAAFTPRLFAEMRDAFSSELPNDVTLRHYLIKKQFLPKAADEIIRVYRDNLELVRQEAAAYNEEMIQPAQEKTTAATPQSVTVSDPPMASGVQMHLSENAVKISYNGKITQEVVQKLIDYLTISKDQFPTKQQSTAEQSKPEQSNGTPAARSDFAATKTGQ